MEQGITFVLSGKTFHLVDISNEGESWFSLSETSKRYISKINFNKCNLKWVVEAGFTSIGQQIQKVVQESRELHFQERFDSDYTNDLRDNVLQHMRKLWNNWRRSLRKNVKSKSLHQVLKDVPMGVDKGDWEWLVKEHFLSDKFKAEIHELVQSEPSLTNIEVVEKCFGPQCKGCPVGFGGGIISKELKGGTTSKAALLEELKKLPKKRKEKESLQKRMDILQSKYERLESVVLHQASSPPLGEEFED